MNIYQIIEIVRRELDINSEYLSIGSCNEAMDAKRVIVKIATIDDHDIYDIAHALSLTKKQVCYALDSFHKNIRPGTHLEYKFDRCFKQYNQEEGVIKQ